MTDGVLLDTNIVLRLNDPGIRGALARLRSAGRQICVAPQSCVEAYVVATRPIDVRGFGMTPAEASALVDEIEDEFDVLPDPPDLFGRWRRIVTSSEVRGKRTHDARLAAYAEGHGLGEVVTENVGDFASFAELCGFLVVRPADVEPGGDAGPPESPPEPARTA